MSTTKTITKYVVHIAEHIDGFNEWQTCIYLYDGTNPCADIRFTDIFGSGTRNNQITATFSTLWAPSSAYEKTLDLLRNEKPIYLHLYPSGRALLSTGPEEVGEEEAP